MWQLQTRTFIAFTKRQTVPSRKLQVTSTVEMKTTGLPRVWQRLCSWCRWFCICQNQQGWQKIRKHNQQSSPDFILNLIMPHRVHQAFIHTSRVLLMSKRRIVSWVQGFSSSSVSGVLKIPLSDVSLRNTQVWTKTKMKTLFIIQMLPDRLWYLFGIYDFPGLCGFMVWSVQPWIFLLRPGWIFTQSLKWQEFSAVNNASEIVWNSLLRSSPLEKDMFLVYLFLCAWNIPRICTCFGKF